MLFFLTDYFRLLGGVWLSLPEHEFLIVSFFYPLFLIFILSFVCYFFSLLSISPNPSVSLFLFKSPISIFCSAQTVSHEARSATTNFYRRLCQQQTFRRSAQQTGVQLAGNEDHEVVCPADDFRLCPGGPAKLLASDTTSRSPVVEGTVDR